MIQYMLILPKLIFGMVHAFVVWFSEVFRVKNKISLADIQRLDPELSWQCCCMWREINDSPLSSAMAYMSFIDYADSYIGRIRYLEVHRMAGEIEGANLDVAGYVRALKGLWEQVVKEKKRLAALEAKRLSGINEARELVNLAKKETGQLSLTEDRKPVKKPQKVKR